MELSQPPTSGSRESTVLIAFDDDPVRALIRLVLEGGGYRVVAEAADAPGVLTKISLHDPDVVVLDEDLPRMNGLQAAQLIRDVTPDIGIVICSTEEASRLWADATIAKKDLAYLPLALDRVALDRVALDRVAG